MTREKAQIPYPMRVYGEISGRESARIGANKTAPGGASTPLIQGPRRSVKGTD